MPSRTPTVAILLEAVMVTTLAAAFAFAANALSPRGLILARDYFPAAANPSNSLSKVAPPAAANAASTNQPAGISETDQRIKQNGLQPIDRARAERLFRDPRYLQGLVVFVDGRDKEHYADGHVPGAFPLDRYHPGKDLTDVLTPCQNADLVVVYCTGRDCDDADYTALLLRDAGVPIQKLLVYGGGFDDWAASHLPIEQGARNSSFAPAENK